MESNYYPSNLVNTYSRSLSHLDTNYQVLLVDIVYKYFKEMQKDALQLGYDIEVDSAYRSYEYQQKILDDLYKKKGEEAYKMVALPGASEHQTGLAFDFCLFINGIYTDEIKDDQEETKWIHNNCYKYGFILRYPKGKEDITGYNYEPWHLRYVGKELAKRIYENNITLEEYYQLNKNIF